MPILESLPEDVPDIKQQIRDRILNSLRNADDYMWPVAIEGEPHLIGIETESGDLFYLEIQES